MIERAGQRGAYDELLVAELTDYLKSQVSQYDLIVAADTLVYFGSLDELLAAAAAALREPGHLVFTVERLDDRSNKAEATTGFFLNSHGRYSHAEPYLRRCLAATGFER